MMKITKPKDDFAIRNIDNTMFFTLNKFSIGTLINTSNLSTILKVATFIFIYSN